MSITSKERVLTAFASQQPDRVPVNYLANEGIDQRLKQHFGLEAGDDERLRQALGVDFRQVNVPYVGRKLHADIPERGVRADYWGVHRMWIEHESGGYWDFCDFPLKDATEEEVAAWPLPSPDDFDYTEVAARCTAYGAYGVGTGHPGMCDIINGTASLMGMEQSLITLAVEEPAGLLLIQRRSDIVLEMLRRTIEASKGGIDFLWIGEDLGTQRGPMISMDLYRSALRPLHQRFVDLAKSFDLPVMVHSCGSSSWAFEDFIEMGVTVVDTLQPEALNMEPAYLKKTFGGRLAFHGCISTAGPVAYGTVEDVVRNCRETLEIMMPGGGYCFSPTHSLQDNSPVENVLAMYETARQHGGYPKP